MSLDDITSRVHDQYSRFPYPSREPGEQRLKELANLLRLFALETKYDFRGKSVLDVGTGTGHRLITAARQLPETRFVAVDLSDLPLEIARAAAREAAVTNVEFRRHNLLEGGTELGHFDVVLCMGVLHHLPVPAEGMQQLARLLKEDGFLFTYVYGAPGSGDRMRRKEMLSLLLDREAGNFEAGVRMARELGFDAHAFGWNLNADDPRSVDALIVDSYLNAHETLLDLKAIEDMVRPSGLDGFSVFGITSGTDGYLFDTALKAGGGALMVKWTNMSTFLPTEDLKQAYQALPLRRKQRLIELAFQPNGYTTLAYRRPALRGLSGSRLSRNSIWTDEGPDSG